MRRTFPIIAIGLATLSMGLMPDILSQIAWNQETFENACFQFVRNPESVPYPQITPMMRATAAARRQVVAQALVARAKGYYASDRFLARWEQEVGPTAETLKKQGTAGSAQKKQAEASLAQAEQMMAMLPPAQQAELKKNLAKARKDLATEKAPTQEPTDPNAALKKALKHLLAATDGIDYAAPITRESGSKHHFTNPAFEHKNWEWKMGYRAGKEATEGFRSEVKDWIAELK